MASSLISSISRRVSSSLLSVKPISSVLNAWRSDEVGTSDGVEDDKGLRGGKARLRGLAVARSTYVIKSQRRDQTGVPSRGAAGRVVGIASGHLIACGTPFA